MNTVVFVCRQGQCRSADAAWQFNCLAREAKLEVRATYFGTAQAWGVQEDAMATNPIYVLTVDGRRKEEVSQDFPAFREKVFTMNEFAGQDGGIGDKTVSRDLVKTIFAKVAKSITSGSPAST